MSKKTKRNPNYSNAQLLARLSQKAKGLANLQRIAAKRQIERDNMIREAVARGISYREIGGYARLTHTQIGTIANQGRETQET